MQDSSKLHTYVSNSIEIRTVYVCTLNPTGPIVGFEVKLPGSRYGLLVRAEELKAFIKKKGNIKNAEIFKSNDRDGLILEPCTIRSHSKDFSLSKGEHIVNINDLQKLTWAGNIDYNNKVQLMFTSLC